MEARIAQLEADLAHSRADISDIKVEFRMLRDTLDGGRKRMARCGAPITDLFAFKALQFVIYFVCTAAMFGGLAHGFGWL